MMFNEDCLETLGRGLKYDYIITSPPDFDEIGADTKNTKPYVDFLTQRFSLFNPIGNAVTIFVSDRKADGTIIQKHNIICDIMSSNGWVLRSQKIWVKKEDTIDMFRHGYTFILTFGRNGSKHPLLPDVFTEKFIPATKSYTYNFSPNIVKQFIEVYTSEGDTVYDPFMGSGTTAGVCIETNRGYIGSEIVEDTFKLSNEKITKLNSVTKFFNI